MVAHSALITVMEKAARKAAPRLRRDFNEVDALQVSRKGPADFVSNADRAAEQAIGEILMHARPDWGLLMEESGETIGNDDQARWIVDPLDGTTNFLHGMPHFAISIAAEVHGEVVAGLVHQPLTGESFWAEKGRGAWLSDRRLRVSARRELPDCVIATGIPYQGHGNAAQFSGILSAVMPEVAGVRRFGAAALDLAWVAAGRFDGFWESGLKYWDVAAGILLVREAGGFVTDYRGQDNMVAPRRDRRRQRQYPVRSCIGWWRAPCGRRRRTPLIAVALRHRRPAERFSSIESVFRPCPRLPANICRSCCS